MQTLSEDQLVGQVLGKYRVERYMGKGRLSAVYLVRNLSTQQVDALTVYMVPERFSTEVRVLFLQRFLKEAAAVTGLDHPHILPVYDFGELAGQPYLVTPYTTQGSLADIIKQQGRCEHTYVSELLEQVASGLDYAYKQRFVHGTLKPANIVVRGENTMQVAGFGVMHMLQLSGLEPLKQPYTHLLSVADTFLAASEYLAPEVVQGKTIDARSDIYALGCILYELLSGRPPFSGPDPLATAQHHVQHSVPSLRTLATDVPVALVSVVHQALERDPARRFQHVRDLAEAFAQASQGAIHFTQSLSATRPRAASDRGEPAISSKPPAQPRRRSPLSSSTNSWQLVPPIVTGHQPAIDPARERLLSSRKEGSSASKPYVVPAPPTLAPPMAPDQAQAEPRITKREHSAKPAQATANAKPEQVVGKANNAQLAEEDGFPAEASFVGTPEQIAENARAYAWWSTEQPMKPEQPAKPAPSVTSKPAAQPAEPEWQARISPSGGAAGQAKLPMNGDGKVRLPSGGELNWMMDMDEPSALNGTSKRRSSGAPRKPAMRADRVDLKIKRRKVVAALATGAVVVGAAAFGVKLLNAAPNNQTATTATQNQTAQKAGQTTQPTTPKTSQTTAQQGNGKQGQTAMAGNTGTVITTIKQPTNSAVVYNNSSNILVHLSNGSFVAYNRACTHQGVLVNYHPESQTIICPLHGATFDPKKKGAVLQGPATLPLPMAKIQVNADGTITAL